MLVRTTERFFFQCYHFLLIFFSPFRAGPLLLPQTRTYYWSCIDMSGITPLSSLFPPYRQRRSDNKMATENLCSDRLRVTIDRMIMNPGIIAVLQ